MIHVKVPRLTNGNTAPVCPISRSQAAPGMPGIRVPGVPKAVDLPSAIQAANTIKNILQQIIADQRPVINNIGQPSPNPSGGSSATSHGGGGSTVKRSNWMEVERNTEIWRFFNPDDEDLWIDVERITKIVWKDKGRQTQLTFEYGEGSLDNKMSSGPFPRKLAQRLGSPESNVDWKNYPFGQ